MAMMKKVQVTATLDGKCKVESKIRDHVVYIDQPQQAGGTDSGPTPLEMLFFSLAGCIASIARIMAKQRGISLRSMEITVEGELNLEVLMGKTDQGRVGFTGLRVSVKIDSDMSDEEKRVFLHQVDSHCPVSENLLNATPIEVELVE